MKITGHKTRVVFQRYDIVDERDLIDAAKKIESARDKSQISKSEQPEENKVLRFSRLEDRAHVTWCLMAASYSM
jgi:hypothetical protein